MKEKYINPFTDFGFKKLFGEEANKDLLIDFLNQVLPEEDQIKTLSYKSTENLPRTITDRKAIFDLYCENQAGEKFIIELQRVRQQYFKDRTLYYATFPIQEQAEPGKKWEYQLKAVYTIGLMDFSFDDAIDDYYHHVQLMETYRKEVFYDKLTFIYIELPKFKKQEDELETHFDKWLYLLRHLNEFTSQPTIFQEYVFQKVLKIAEYIQLPSEEKQSYQDSLKTYWDYHASLKTAMESSYESGKEEGKMEVVINSLRKGLDVTTIASITGLSEEKIRQIKDEIGY